MYNIWLIFIWIYLAFIAMSFWESSVEGRNAWHKGKYGWKIKIKGFYVVTRYHFYLSYIMIPLFLTLPLIINGWDIKLMGIIISAYSSGLIIEDFFWYVVNPVVKFRELNTDFASYYPRVKIGKIKIPLFYFVNTFIALLSWWLLWK